MQSGEKCQKYIDGHLYGAHYRPVMTRKSWIPPEKEKERIRHRQRGVATATHTMASAMQYKRATNLTFHQWRQPHIPWCPPCNPAPKKQQQNVTQSAPILPHFSPTTFTQLRLQFQPCNTISRQFHRFLGIQVLCHVYKVLVLSRNSPL